MKQWLVPLLLLGVTASAFSRCLGNGFVDWDDGVLVTANPYVQTLSWRNVAAIFLQPVANAYHPLAFLVWALEYRLWGAAPLGYHLVNLAVHLGTVALVFRWVARLEGSVAAAAVAALWFGIHPMRVESVAWASDLKDLLAGFFFMASLIAAERANRSGRGGVSLVALGLFALAGTSKATAITLPVVLLLGDFLQGRPLDRRSAVKTAPFFAVAALLAAAAVASRLRFEAVVGESLALGAYPWPDRLHVAGHRLVFYYLQRTLAPSWGMAELYPDLEGPFLWRAAIWVGPLSLMVLAVAFSSRFTRKGVFGFGFFVATLAPSLFAVSYGYTADRFSYVPSIGLAYLAGASFAAAARKLRWRPLRLLLVAFLGAAAGLAGAVTWERCAVWRDSVSLWTDGVRQYEHKAGSVNHGVALFNRGRAWMARGEYGRALEDFNGAMPLAPARHQTLCWRGLAHAVLGQADKAKADAREALKLSPGYREASWLLEILESGAPVGLPASGPKVAPD